MDESTQAKESSSPSIAERRDAETREQRVARYTTALRIAFAQRYERARKMPWPRAKDPEVDHLASWLASAAKDIDTDLAKLLDAFFADPYVQERDYPIGLLRKQAPRYLSPPSKVRDVTKGFVPPAPAEAFLHMPKNEQEVKAQLDNLFGPEVSTTRGIQ